MQRALFGDRGDTPLVLRWLLRRNRSCEEARRLYAPFTALSEADAPTREGVAETVADALRRGREVYVIANNKAEGSAPLTLREQARRLRDGPAGAG